jgi:hypothetical protein
MGTLQVKRQVVAVSATAVGATALLSLAACASTTPQQSRHHAAPAVAVSTTAAPVPGAAACSQASGLGHDIAYGYSDSGTDYPTLAVLREWDRQLSALTIATSYPKSVPADNTEFTAIGSDAYQVELRIIPALYTGFGNSPPMPVRSVNWNAVDRYAAQLQGACLP